MMKIDQGGVFLRVVAVVLLLGAMLVLSWRGVKVQTNLYDLLPSGGGAAVHSLERMAEAGSRQVNVLIKGDSEKEVLDSALALCEKLPPVFCRMSDDKALVQLASTLQPYRFQLLSARHRGLLQQGKTEVLRDEALTNLYSFVPLALFPVDDDPYCFATSFLLENPLLNKKNFEMQQGIMLGRLDASWYAYMPLMISGDTASSLSLLQQEIAKLSELCEQMGALLCGTPVHTWKASSSSQRAMGALSMVSVLMVLGLFLGVFVSLRGMLIMVLTLAASGVISLGTAMLLHGSVHILALVFGCSLVGISSDYMVHYLVAHHDDADARVSASLLRALLLGLLTSVLGYSTFYLTGVGLLAQIATVSVSGLLSAMLLIVAFYPRVYAGHLPVRLTGGALRVGACISRWRFGMGLPWLLGVVMLGLSFWKLTTCDDLRSFYRPDAQLMEAEKQLARLNGMEQGLMTLVVSSENAEQNLQRQEMLAHMLEQAGVENYTAVASLVPSACRQRENFDMVRKLVAAHVDEVPLSMPDEWPGTLQPDALWKASSSFASLSALWDANHSVVLVPGKYREQLNLLESVPWVTVADRFAALQTEIGMWREQLMRLLCVVGIVVVLLLSCCFGFRAALGICGPVLAGISCVFGVLAAFGLPLTLFHVLACYLILGLGCDYAIFRATQQGSQTLPALAVGISFLTSWAMFGVLAFTSFSVTHDMGLAVSIGLTVAYVLSPAARGAIRR